MTARQAFDLYQAGRPAEAAMLCERLVGDDPAAIAAWHVLGVSRLALGLTVQALDALDHALALDPARAGVLSARAAALVALERLEDGLAACDIALAVDPDNPVVLNAQGVALRRLGRPAEALAAYDRALALSPGFVDALCNRGGALADLGRFDQALAAHDKACAAAPDHAQALANRAALLMLLGRPIEAARDLERVVALNPRHPRALGDLLHARRQVCDWRDDAALLSAIEADLRADRLAISPFAALSAFDDPALHRVAARLTAPPAGPPPAWSSRPDRERIRVAYLSADLHDHATARLMAGVLEAHDRARFEILALSHGPDLGGPLRERIDATFERRIDVRRMSDAAVAALARELGVDIVVDLKGYTQDGRPGILAHRAAPVQVSWLGYPGTLAAPYVDHVIADGVVLPPGAEGDWSEAVVRLPFYQPNDALAPPGSPPARQAEGLPDDAFVFACLNNPAKITPEAFAAWMAILSGAPGAVLWLYEGSAGVAANLRARAAEAGIEPGRLMFAKPAPHADHLARQALADLVLDTWPYGAHTTASDALRMGVPLLTLPGASFASRVGASLLTALDLPALIAPDVEAYVAAAVRLAADRPALRALKQRLEGALRTSAVFDPAAFARTLEAAFEALHARARAGLAPAGFDIDPV
ncbi:tetratricopeptide repeat protein [Caulobacter soli]|uniref:O-linked N-acetylglucosamine transferase, SPINDLY family protein n=1 Tax=Caulobacter soli TaxID=2708539 RepID=UPI0013ED3158|nr:tetratricopeptide repeat protein [Caulobacter soli]